MKLWQAILLTIVIIWLTSNFVPEALISQIDALIAALSAIWVYNNAKKIDVQKYKSNLSMSPLALALWTFFVWPIFFPAYLGLVWRVKNDKQPLKTVQIKAT